MAAIQMDLQVRHMRQRMQQSMLHWEWEQDPEDTLAMAIRSRQIAEVRVSDVAGGKCRGHRNASHIAYDDGAYVGIVCELDGHEYCGSKGQDWESQPGDVVIWRNNSELDFRVDDWCHKVIMLVPEARFETVLRAPIKDATWLLRGDTALGALISSFMSALASNLDRLDERAAESAVEMALDLIGSAVNVDVSPPDAAKRSSLYDRILNFIDRRLEDADLTPGKVARAHGISVRYLHLLFANHGETVSGWIRERRLLRCREELELSRKGMSLTEIAHYWGFSDGAHFSRTFKKRFGVPPKAWREQHRKGPLMISAGVA